MNNFRKLAISAGILLYHLYEFRCPEPPVSGTCKLDELSCKCF